MQHFRHLCIASAANSPALPSMSEARCCRRRRLSGGDAPVLSGSRHWRILAIVDGAGSKRTALSWRKGRPRTGNGNGRGFPCSRQQRCGKERHAVLPSQREGSTRGTDIERCHTSFRRRVRLCPRLRFFVSVHGRKCSPRSLGERPARVEDRRRSDAEAETSGGGRELTPWSTPARLRRLTRVDLVLRRGFGRHGYSVGGELLDFQRSFIHANQPVQNRFHRPDNA